MEDNEFKIENCVNEFDDFKKRKEKEELEYYINLLENNIDFEIKITKDEETKKLFQKVKSIKCETQEEYDFKDWLWNYGKLRTSEEIEEYKKKKANEEWYKTEWKNTDTGLYKFLAFTPVFIPIIGMLCSLPPDGDCGFFFTCLFLLIPAIIVSCIISACIDTATINEAKKHDVSPYDPKLRKTIRSRNTAIGGAVGGAAGIVSGTKKAVKGVTDVDNWPKL